MTQAFCAGRLEGFAGICVDDDRRESGAVAALGDRVMAVTIAPRVGGVGCAQRYDGNGGYAEEAETKRARRRRFDSQHRIPRPIPALIASF